MPEILTAPERGKVEDGSTIVVPQRGKVPVVEEEHDLDSIYCHLFCSCYPKTTLCGMPDEFAYTHPPVYIPDGATRCACGNALCPKCKELDHDHC